MSRSAVAKSVLIALLGTTPLGPLALAAEPAATAQRIDVPAGDLITALETLAKQADVDLVYQDAQVKGLATRGVQGNLSPRDAVLKLIEGTPLQLRTDPDTGAILITPRAASGATSATDAANDQVEEIIVTATKRTERLVDVPLSVQAIGGRQLERIGAVNFADYARTVAGISFQDSGAGRSQIFVRGVSTGGDVDTGKESTVAVYIDETPVTEGSSQPDLKLYDIDRVEVLRGPQGTLYGSGSMGGTLRLITKQPRFERVEGYVQGKGSLVHEGGAGGSVDAMINVPLTNNLALRVVGYGIREDGFLDNGFSGAEDINDEDTWGLRAALRYKPTDALDVTLTGYHQQTDIGAYYQVTDHYPRLVIDQSAKEDFDDKFSIGNLRVEYDLGPAQLTSSTSYFDRHRAFGNDIDWFTELVAGIPRANSPLYYDVTAFSEELRMTSTGSSAFKWLVGLFYLDRDEDSGQSINPAGVPVPSDPNANVFYSRTLASTQQLAGFLELGYELFAGFTVTGGVRVSKIDRDLTAIKAGVLIGAYSSLSGDADETPVTPKINVSYRLRDGALLYAQASQGFRVGGVNPGLPNCGTCAVSLGTTFDSDSLWNYELGAKFELFDRALRLNAAAFYIDWTDIQLNVSREDGFNGFLNAGDARSRGGELEVSLSAGAGIELGGQLTYTDAELTRVRPGVTGVGTPGSRVPEVPEWSRSGYIEWVRPVLGDAEFRIRGDVQYVGERKNSFSGERPMASYTLYNLSLGLDIGNYTASLFGKNLSDERAQLRRQFYAGLHDGVPIEFDRYTINIPRTIGVALMRRF
jgi:iron complex outermembrane receptor protein